MAGGARALTLYSIVLLVMFSAGFALWGIFPFYAPGPLAENKNIVIPPGVGVRGITAVLKGAGAVESPLVFQAGLFISRSAGRLKAGEYEIPAHASYADITALLAEGKTVIRRFTVPEGFTSAQVKTLLLNEQALSGDIPPLMEGTLLPETYHFSFQDDRGRLVQRMQAAMQEMLDKEWAVRGEGLPLLTLQQAVVLASVIEKETGVTSERAMVAAVYINRLKKNMPLQADPTIVYGIEKDKGPLNRALVLKDLEYDSPYNTYKYPGLPPGPICNPGKESIHAALHPANSTALYFVATGNGGHRFSATLKEHLRNVQEYRQTRKKAD